MYSINENGVNVPTLQEVIDYYTEGLKSIYGDNINLKQNTPDGQLINLISQQHADIGELIMYYTNTYDINTSEGRFLDRNVSFNGIIRKGGTYTQVPIQVVVNDTVSLQGLDGDYDNVNGTGFTISDGIGNNFILISSITLTAGTYNLLFRAELLGDVEPVLNSITLITTPQLGVVSVNNPAAPIVIGEQEESDYELRNRFFQSYDLGTYGAYDSVLSALYNLEGVISVNGENNYENTTSTSGTPAHTAWFVVLGGDQDEIADVIHKTLDGGCGLRGNVVVSVPNVYGTYDVIKFDRPTVENLYVKFSITRKKSSYVVDDTYIKQQLVELLKFQINGMVDSSTIDNLLTSIDSNLVYSDIQLSLDNLTWSELVKNTNINYIFILSVNDITITIN